jgi:hypothetical protein
MTRSDAGLNEIVWTGRADIRRTHTLFVVRVMLDAALTSRRLETSNFEEYRALGRKPFI